MPTEKKPKLLCENNIRHAEYYDMQAVLDDLYCRSTRNEVFTNLIELILSRENILLAYRNIKTNTGSNTAKIRMINIFFIFISPDTYLMPMVFPGAI